GTQEWSGYPTPWGANTMYQMLVDSVQISCGGDSTHPSSPPPASSVHPTALPSSSLYPTALPSTSPIVPSQPPQKCIPRPTYY
ncbi:hypothetical protein GGH95_005302, partial [Coemansia sp. RSA 1836]